MQEMGRVDRGHDAEPGDHRYEIFLSFNVVMNLFLRIFQNYSEKVRNVEMEQVFVVLRFLVLPSMCYHTFIEQYFEPLLSSGQPSHHDATPCGNMCTYCLEGHLEFTLPFDKEALRDILMSDIFWPEGRIPLPQFQKRMAENVLPIYGGCPEFVKTVKPQHIHALCLQLVAANFVRITVPNEKLIGTKKLNKTDLHVTLVKDDVSRRFRISDESQWDENHFHFK